MEEFLLQNRSLEYIHIDQFRKMPFIILNHYMLDENICRFCTVQITQLAIRYVYKKATSLIFITDFIICPCRSYAMFE